MINIKKDYINLLEKNKMNENQNSEIKNLIRWGIIFIIIICFISLIMVIIFSIWINSQAFYFWSNLLTSAFFFIIGLILGRYALS